MEIVKPTTEYWKQDNIIDHVAKCARICYASDRTIHNNEMCNALQKNKHFSMFRQAGVYYIIPINRINNIKYISNLIDTVAIKNDNYLYLSTNEQVAKEHLLNYHIYRISFDEAEKNKVFYNNEILRYTIVVSTGIDITRELNRKSPNNIAEQSTRYVDFTKKVGIRFKECHWMPECNLYRRLLYKFMLKTTEWFYKIARNKYGLNLYAQDARFILPLDTMSKVAYTYTVKDWRHIIDLRYYGTTGKPHPDAKIIASQIRDCLINLGYEFRTEPE